MRESMATTGKIRVRAYEHVWCRCVSGGPERDGVRGRGKPSWGLDRARTGGIRRLGVGHATMGERSGMQAELDAMGMERDSAGRARRA